MPDAGHSLQEFECADRSSDGTDGPYHAMPIGISCMKLWGYAAVLTDDKAGLGSIRTETQLG